MTAKKVAPRTVTKLSPDELKLDPRNPRLYNGRSFTGSAAEQDLVKALADHADLDELLKSISENGYMPIEPLIIIKYSGDKEYTVLEGNRRLAALKLLKDPELAKKCRIVIPKNIPAEILKSLNEVAVYLVSEESEARSFIGFKHVNGPHKWDSFAKAQFAYNWFVSERSNGLTIDEITRKLGDSNNTVRSIVGAMFVLEQAKKNDIYDINADKTTPRFSFSHLYTALNRNEYKEFLGLSRDWNVTMIDDPIPAGKLDHLKDVLIGLYGYKKDNRASLITSQNPDLKHFGEVLVNEVSYDSFKTGAYTLSDLYKQAGDPQQHIKEAFIGINYHLDTISAVLDRTDVIDSYTNNYFEQFKKKVGKIIFQIDNLDKMD